MTVIEKIESKTTKKGATYYLVNAGGENYSAFKGTEAFRQISEKVFVEGSDVKINFESSGSYKNLTHLEVGDNPSQVPKAVFKPASTQPRTPPLVLGKESYWEAKAQYDKIRDIRITRMNCLARATEVAIANATMIIGEHKEITMEELEKLTEKAVAIVNKGTEGT